MYSKKYTREVESFAAKHDWSIRERIAAKYLAYHMLNFTTAEDVSCEGCKYERGRHCSLDVGNNCSRVAEDYYGGSGDE